MKLSFQDKAVDSPSKLRSARQSNHKCEVTEQVPLTRPITIGVQVKPWD
jgi:hypothetical protein